FKVAYAAGHAHHAQHVQRHEGHVEAHQPEPERALAPERVELVAEGLGEPVGDAGHQPEQHAADDDVVKVRHQEQAVVQDEVTRRYVQYYAWHTTAHASVDHSHRPQPVAFELHAATVHGDQPV